MFELEIQIQVMTADAGRRAPASTEGMMVMAQRLSDDTVC